jgi:hypothetical protein
MLLERREGPGQVSVARAALSTLFDTILPMRVQENCIFGWIAWFSKHSEGLKLIKLSDFIGMPKRPGIKGLESFTGKRAQGALSIGDRFGLKS